MKLELPNGTVIEGSDQITLDIRDIADVILGNRRLEQRVAELEKVNSILVDASASNSVLRSNVEKSKKAAKFQRASALLYRKAARALWKTFAIQIGQIDDDGTRPMSLIDKESGDITKISIPAERAVFIERVFKPDGTFANRDDVFALIKERDEQFRRHNGEGEDDE